MEPREKLRYYYPETQEKHLKLKSIKRNLCHSKARLGGLYKVQKGSLRYEENFWLYMKEILRAMIPATPRLSKKEMSKRIMGTQSEMRHYSIKITGPTHVSMKISMV